MGQHLIVCLYLCQFYIMKYYSKQKFSFLQKSLLPFSGWLTFNRETWADLLPQPYYPDFTIKIAKVNEHWLGYFTCSVFNCFLVCVFYILHFLSISPLAARWGIDFWIISNANCVPLMKHMQQRPQHPHNHIAITGPSWNGHQVNPAKQCEIA